MKTEKQIKQRLVVLQLQLLDAKEWEQEAHYNMEQNEFIHKEDDLEAEHYDACIAVSKLNREIALLEWVLEDDQSSTSVDGMVDWRETQG